MSEIEPSATGGCPVALGMARHLEPAGDQNDIVTKRSSDDIFGADGLGLGRTPWTTVLSWLARNGIQEQTGSKKNQTDIEGCVKGWGQGPYSTRVFNAETGIDADQMDRLLAHLEGIAAEKGAKNGRITESVLGVLVESQNPKPYSTWTGMREAKSFWERTTARFRGHIQWQGLITLTGQVDRDGVTHVSPELLRDFFTAEEPFFASIRDRRKDLREGRIQPGDPSGLLADTPDYVDKVATDRRYNTNKSGLWIILRILGYMATRRKSSLGSL